MRYVVNITHSIHTVAFVLTNSSTGACILYGISRVVIGENNTFLGGESYLKQRGVEVINLENKECQDLMERFIAEKPEVWFVDTSPCYKIDSLLT